MSFPGADLGSAHAQIVIDDDLRGLQRAITALDQLDRKSQVSTETLNKIAATGAVVGGALGAGLGLAVRSFAGFEHEMNAVRAVSGATGEQFDQLNALALKIGKDTVFSASEAATALEELSKAGVSINDILNGAADGATALAAAAGVGIPQAATLIANALNTFGLAGDQATHIADVFTNVANVSAADATSFGNALTYVGGSAKALNIPIEDVAASIALLADQSIQGTHAGSALNDLLTRIVAPTDKAASAQRALGLVVTDAAGNFVGLTSIYEQVARATANLGDVQRQKLLTDAFGIEGARAMNAVIAAQRNAVAGTGKGWQDYEAAVTQSGSAVDQANIRMAGLDGAVQDLSGSLEVAKINFGKGLAPAVEVAAGAIGKAADAFAALPSGIQTTIGAIAAATAGLALLTAAGSKAVVIGRDTVTTWRKLADAFTGAQRGCSQSADCLAATGRNAETAAGQMGPLLGNLKTLGKFAATGIQIGVTIVGLELISDTIRHAAEGAQSGPSQDDTIAFHVEHGIGRALDKIPGNPIGDWLKHDANETLSDQELFKTVGDLGFKINQTFVGGLLTKTSESTIEGLGGKTVRDIQELAAREGITFKSALLQQAAAAGVVTPEIEAYKRAQQDATRETKSNTTATQDNAAAVDQQTDALSQQVQETIAQQEAQAQLKQAVQETQNAQFLAAAQAQGLFLPYTRGADDVAKATADFNQDLDALTAGAVNAIAGLDDIAPTLDGMQAGFGRAGDSTATLLSKMDDVGAIDLSPAEREALNLQRRLEGVERAISDTAAAITQNGDDIAMWQSRISLVDDTLGTAADGYANLNKLVADGKLTQEEANQILQAGIWLRERSVGGIEDEEAAQARLIPILAEYVRQHDAADGAVKNLTDQQKGFLAAMQQSQTQTFLQTLQLLLYLQAMGQIPPEKVTKFIADSSAADPIIAGVVDDLGIVGAGATAPIDADTSDADTKINNLIAQPLPTKNLTVGVSVVTATERFDEDPAAAMAGAAGTGTGIAAIQAQIDGLHAPDPISITVTDEASPVIAAIAASIDALSDGAKDEGAQISTALADGLTDSAKTISPALDGVRGTINTGLSAIQLAAKAWGEATGANFTVAFANALAAGANAIYQAAYTVAYNAYLGAKAALGIRSPSTAATDLASNFGGTFIDVLRAQERQTAQAGASLANAVTGAMQDTLTSPALRSLLAPPRPILSVLAPTPTAAARPPANVIVNAPITVNGVSDPNAAADAVVTRLFQTSQRLGLAGAIGGAA